MQRRAFLRAAPASMMLAGASIRPTPARAEIILIVIAVIGLILSVIKLFTPQGGGAALQWYQIQMLAAISDKIDTLQDELNRMARRIEELKDIIGDLPSKVVIEDRSASINGASFLYKRYLDEMARYQAENGIVKAHQKYEPVIRTECLNYLNRARADLMGSYTSLALIPQLAFSARLELDMRVLVDDSPDTMLSCISEYRKWFQTVTFGNDPSRLEGAMLQTMKRRDELISQYVKPVQSYCKSDYRERKWDIKETFQVGGGQNAHDVTRKVAEYLSRAANVHHDVLDIHRDVFADPTLEAAVKGMVESGLFDDTTRPRQNTQYFEMPQPWYGLTEAVRPQDQSVVDTYKRDDKEKQNARDQHVTWDNLPTFPECDHNLLNIRGEYRDVASQMTDLELRIMTLRAWRYGSDTVLSFLDKREADIKALPPPRPATPPVVRRG